MGKKEARKKAKEASAARVKKLNAEKKAASASAAKKKTAAARSVSPHCPQRMACACPCRYRLAVYVHHMRSCYALIVLHPRAYPPRRPPSERLRVRSKLTHASLIMCFCAHAPRAPTHTAPHHPHTFRPLVRLRASWRRPRRSRSPPGPPSGPSAAVAPAGAPATAAAAAAAAGAGLGARSGARAWSAAAVRARGVTVRARCGLAARLQTSIAVPVVIDATVSAARKA